MDLLNKIFKRKHPDWKEKNDFVIEFVTNDGIEDIYTLKDIANTYTHRGFAALAAWEEWDMRVNKEYLEGCLIRFSEILSNPQSINLGEVYKIVEELKVRMKFIVPTEDLILKYASVIFFDKHESPYKYDEKYGKEKINRWKSRLDMINFFFALPIRSFLPLPNISEQDLKTCLLTANLIGVDQMNEMLSKLSPEQLRDGLISELEYQKSLISTSIE